MRRLIVAASVSALGDGIAAIALPLFAASLTRDARLVTGLYAVELLPWLLFGSRVARRADLGRRPARTMLKADVVRGLVLAGVALSIGMGSTNLALLYLCAALIGTGFVIHSSAASTLLPDIASGDVLARANGFLFAVEAAGVALVGPALGGWLFGASKSLPFVLDAGSFFASALVVAGWWNREPRAVRGEADADLSESASARVLAHRLLRPLFVVGVSTAAAQALVLSSAVLFATRVLRLSASGFGLFMAVTAVGNVAAGVLTPRIWRGHRHTRALLLGAVGTVGLSYVVLGATRRPVVACLVLVAEAVAVGVLGTINPTLRLENAGGRVAAVSTFFRQGTYTAHAVGGLAAGLMVTRLGFSTTYTIAGIMALAMLVVVPGIARQVKPLGSHDAGVVAEHDPIATTLGLVGATHADEQAVEPIRWEPPLVPDRAGW